MLNATVFSHCNQFSNQSVASFYLPPYPWTCLDSGLTDFSMVGKDGEAGKKRWEDEGKVRTGKGDPNKVFENSQNSYSWSLNSPVFECNMTCLYWISNQHNSLAANNPEEGKKAKATCPQQL